MHRALLRFACSAALLLGASQAHADILLNIGPGAVQPEENLLFNDGSLIAGPALTVQGITDQSGAVFNLTGTENLVVSGGQARVEDEAEDGFNSLTIDALDAAIFFTEFEANLNAFGSGSALVTATDSTGAQFVFNLFPVNGGGQNFFSLEAVDGQLINTVQIITQGTFLQDVRQIRVGGITTDDTPDPVPEPTVMALFGLALLGAGILRRRSTH